MYCHILKTGNFKDSNGNKHTFTLSDLDKIVYQFNNNHNRVPICVGHPKTNSPAYGWINEVKRIGDNLYCDFKDVQEEFKTAVKKGLFKNRSISLDSDFNIRHLAFLGGQAPAIKGLEQFCFEAEDKENLLNLNINEFKDNYDDEKGKDKQVQEDLKKQIADLQIENQQLKAQIEAEKIEEQKRDFEDFCSEAVKNGNILPKHKEKVINILHACSDFGSFDFSDGNSVDALETAKEFIKSIKMFDFEDFVENGKDINNFEDFDSSKWASEITKTIKENSKKGIKMTEEKAVAVIKRRG